MSRCFLRDLSRKGQVVNLPDKELRYLRTVCAVTPHLRGGVGYPLCMSPCSPDHLIAASSELLRPAYGL
jgi:hypothetical protein